MAYDGRNNPLRKQEAVGMEELVNQFIREMKLASGLNRQRVSDAWNAVSGAGRYTLGVTFERGTLVCSISSSVVRNQLYLQRESLIAGLNEMLKADEIVVKNLILK